MDSNFSDCTPAAPQIQISISLTYSKAVNFAIQQGHFPVIQGLELTPEGTEVLHDVSVRIEAHPAFAQPVQLHLGDMAPGQPVAVSGADLPLALDPDFLMGLTEGLSGELGLTLASAGQEIASHRYPVNIMPYNHWTGIQFPETAAAFVTPNHPLVTAILRRAAEKMGEWTGHPALTGYQRQSENDALRQMAAIYAALEEQAFTYCTAPASFEVIGQKIRMCGDLIEGRLGNCIDLSLLYAACLEGAGLHPLLICIEGHAFTGCWLTDSLFPTPCQDDASLITKRLDKSVGEMAVVECTDFCAGKKVPFEQAMLDAENHLLASDVHFFIDIVQARRFGIRPLPQFKYTPDGRRMTFAEMMAEEEAERAREKAATQSAPAEFQVLRDAGTAAPSKFSKERLWQNKLLNLSTRNSLLNFRPAGTSIQLACDRLETLEDALAAGDEFRILEFFAPAESCSADDHFIVLPKSEAVSQVLQGEFENHRLRTFLNERETEKRIISLYRSARVSLEENGSNTLYLAMGFLKWFETDQSEKARYAPLILLPLEIIRKSARMGYVIRARDEETQFNVTLLEKLRAEFDLPIGGLDPLPLDDSGVDIKKIFATVRHAVMNKKRWDVVEYAFIGQFSFSQYIMWNDIRARADDLRAHPIVRALIRGSLEAPLPELETANGLDERLKPSDLAAPLSADSSQLAAICSAAKGCSFVLHGPPGTGKSQTITNMIANALFNGKSVLFIAEKMAALSVVQKRLEKIGLGPFCLELHSNKSTKTAVTKQLDAALHAARLKSPEAYAAEAEELRRSRESLNELMNKVHCVRTSGLSLYECIGQYEAHRELAGEIRIPAKVLAEATAETRQNWKSIAEKLSIAAARCGKLQNHPLAAWHQAHYAEGVRAEVAELLDEVPKRIQALASAAQALREAAPALSVLDGGANAPQLGTLRQALSESGALDAVPEGLFRRDAASLKAPLVQAMEASGRLKSVQKALDAHFEAEIYELDPDALRRQWKEALDKWFIPRFFAKRKVIKELKYRARDPKSFDEARLPETLKSLCEVKRLTAGIGQLGETAGLAAVWGNAWQKSESDWAAMTAQFEASQALRQALRAVCADEGALEKACRAASQLDEFRAALNPRLAAFLQAADEVKSTVRRLAELTRPTREDALRLVSASPEEAAKTCAAWKAALPDWRDWCGYVAQRDALAQAGLASAAEALESGRVTPQNFPNALEGAAAYGLAIQYIDQDDALTHLNSEMLDYEIQKYRDANSKFQSLTCQELVARLSANIPNASAYAGDTSEVGILKKNIASKCRNTSIRRLFDSIPNLLRRLAPCMLMSPISVAQYIDPKFPQFDLIIFDEASQMPTSEAVGAIARGKSLIVVGDPRQMPPTSFFKKGYTDEDNLEKEDLESILDDCLAISMPETHLLWHYRSRDESLIAFSNYKYYDRNLYTFPSPNDLKGAVRFIPVKGYYDKGGSRQNLAEAEAIVAEVVRRLKSNDPKVRRQSIGIVSFSAVQQNLIDDLLEQAFALSPQLEERSKASGEPIFVKNLESVQGDERDVIMFSVGYGPDEDGHVSLNFGPLNNAGGWRRLNVAVSRARQEMLVFSTLEPEQIDLSRTNAEGVAGLKGFLAFAKNGRSALALSAGENTAHALPSPDAFRQSVAAALTQMGYQTAENVGTSQYKLDLAVVHPKHPDKFILGILCDGENYHNSATARDRNLLQESVLRGLGWNVLRLWAVEWFLYRDSQKRILQKVDERIQAILKDEEAREKAELEEQSKLNASDETGAPECPPSDSSDDAAVQNNINNTNNAAEAAPQDASQEAEAGPKQPVYAVARLPAPPIWGDFYAPQNTRTIREQIRAAAAAEGPVSEGQLMDRIAERWDMRRTGKFSDRINAIVNAEMNLPHPAWQVSKEMRGGREVRFFWNGAPEVLVEFRVPGDDFRRPLEDISFSEIAALIRNIVREQMSIEEAELCKIIAGAAGYTRVTSAMRTILTQAVEYAVQTGAAVRQGGRVALS